MPTKTWKGYVQFGLLSIPVYLNTGARDDKSIGFNTLHKKDKGRVRMPKTCEICEEKLEAADIVKGYQLADKSYVLVTDEELDAIEPESSSIMEIKHCVDAKAVDAIYLAESFYLLPEDPGRKAYALLVKALADSGKVAIALLCKNNRENVVLLRPKQNGLIAHFLYYANEVNRNPEFESLTPPAITANESKLAAKLVESMAEPFKIEQYKDGYRERLNVLIASKMDKTVKAPAPIKAQTPKVMDLMAALEASLKRPRAVALEDAPVDKKKTRKSA